MATRTARLCILMEESTRKLVDQTAEREGVSVSKAAEVLVLRGIKHGCTPQEVQLIVDGMAEAICESLNDKVQELADTFNKKVDAVLESIDGNREQLSEATHEMKLAEKNIGNGTQASLSNLAFTMWYGKLFLKASNMIAFSEGEGPGGYVAENVKIVDLYNWFWQVGGALRRNPSAKNFYPAFRQTPDVLKGHDLEAVTGISSEDWERAIGKSDTEAIAGLAKNNNRNKSRNQYGRNKNHEGGNSYGERK